MELVIKDLLKNIMYILWFIEKFCIFIGRPPAWYIRLCIQLEP